MNIDTQREALNIGRFPLQSTNEGFKNCRQLSCCSSHSDGIRKGKSMNYHADPELHVTEDDEWKWRPDFENMVLESEYCPDCGQPFLDHHSHNPDLYPIQEEVVERERENEDEEERT
jgi:hypothetical protein